MTASHELWHSLPAELHILIIKHMKGDDVLTARRVSATWNSLVSNAQLGDVFVRDTRSLRFLFDRFWLNDIFSSRVFCLPFEKYEDLYRIVYFMATERRKENGGFRTCRAILSFALLLNEELTRRYSDDIRLVRHVLEEVFKFLDRFYIPVMGLPSLADQLLSSTAP